MRYPVGTVVVMEATEYRNDAGVVVDPADVVLWWREPDGSEVTKPKSALTNPAVGSWLWEQLADQVGDWAYTFTSTDPTIVIEGSFEVVAVASTRGPLEPTAGPCEPWITVGELVDGWTPPTGVSDATLARCVSASSDLMFERSGRQFPGICIDQVRPSGVCGGMPIVVYPFGGSLYELGGFDSPTFPGRHSHLVNPESPFELSLGSYPIRSVQEVRIDGEALDSDRWVVMDYSKLRRVDGIAWPCCNFIVGDVARIEVDFTFGQAPPDSGVLASNVLAKELAKAMGGEGCALDRRVQSINREGITMTIPGLVDSLKDGKTGIPEVDLFLWAHNPAGLQKRARIIIPGAASTRRRTFPR